MIQNWLPKEFFPKGLCQSSSDQNGGGLNLQAASKRLTGFPLWLVFADSMLTNRAPVGAAAANGFPANRFTALPARLPTTAVDPCLAAVVAIDTFEIPEVTEGGSTGTDAHLEDLHKV